MQSTLVMSYQPKLHDLRVYKRTRKATGFAISILENGITKHLSRTLLDKHFGTQGRPLGRYLREKLLICTDDNYSKKKKITKQYRLNAQGAAELREKLRSSRHHNSILTRKAPKEAKDNYQQNIDIVNEEEEFVRDYFDYEYHKQLTTGNITYNIKSDRFWNSLQSLPRTIRTKLLAEYGYVHQYDIESAAPTLLYQYARMKGLTKTLPAYERYLECKDQIRTELAILLDIPKEAVKELLTAILNGAHFGFNPDFSTTKLLNWDFRKIDTLKHNDFFMAFREDVKEIWNILSKEIQPKFIILKKTGKKRKLPINSKQKAALYRELERSFIQLLHAYLHTKSNHHLLEHDGWTSKVPVDLQELHDLVHEQLGFKLKFSYQCHAFESPSKEINESICFND